MKTQDYQKKAGRNEADRFDRKSSKNNLPKKDKSSKKRLSIYDEFDEEDLDNFYSSQNDQYLDDEDN